MRRVEYAPKTCANCGLEFVPRDAAKNRTQQHCSRECYWRAKHPGQPAKSCGHCGASFTPKDAYEARRRRFCSPSCAQKASWAADPTRAGRFTGKTHSDESKRAIATANMRRWAAIPRTPPEERICAACGEPFLLTNGNKSTRRYCGKSCAIRGRGRGEDHPNWRGGRHLNGNGYMTVRIDGRICLEHRVVMEAVMGRSLRPEENVHHINGDRADNRLENLELWSESQPSGQRVADKVEWAKALLALYEPEALR